MSVGANMAGKCKTIRLRGYNYSQKGAYYVTICVNDHACRGASRSALSVKSNNIFGWVKNKKMILNDSGEMVQRVWDEIPGYYGGIGIDCFQIMPNHIYGISMLVGAGTGGCPCGNSIQTKDVL